MLYLKAMTNVPELLPGYRAHKKDAGMDLISIQRVILSPLQTQKIDTNLHILIPEGMVGWVLPRSGLSSQGLLVHTGTIDPDYTGTLRVVVTNLNKKKFEISQGMRLAQLILIRTEAFELEMVDSFPETERGDNGFSSSGLFIKEAI